ncbi:MAG: 3-oxoacyl-ACP reductase FabG [Methanomassiliicoccales archaeon]|nr:MAG: 3-oxoacyl-ACP reductase FabG [Methanomassiliicoccales archaeon]
MTTKAVIVTGASRGIGKTTALKLAQEGYAVGVNYKDNEKNAKEVVKNILDLGGEAMELRADVGNETQVNEMIKAFVGEYNDIYGLVNNAGIYKRKRFFELTLQEWEETIATNLTGAFLCTKVALPHITEGGRIVNLARVLAHMGSSQGAHYAASKAGIIGFSKSLARELSPRKITVNIVAPGATETDIIAYDTPEKRKERENITPLGRVGQPEEITDAIIFLLSDKAEYITGETINVNGGMWMV